MACKLSFSEIKEIKEIVENDWREAVEKISQEEDDFTIGDYRFINYDNIDEIMQEEMKSDEYVLGCFNASFIAQVTGWPLALIEAAQKGNAYQALGETIIKEGYLEKMQQEYASADGYGNHFAHYDGEEHEIRFEHTGKYYYFKVN